MQVAIMRVTIDRTGRQLEEKIVGYKEVDEDDYYRPLVEIFGERILKERQKAIRT